MDGTLAQKQAYHILFVQLIHIVQSQFIIELFMQVNIIQWLDGVNIMFFNRIYIQIKTSFLLLLQSSTAVLGHITLTECSALSARSSRTSRDTWITCLSAFILLEYNSIRWIPCPPENECKSRSATPNK